MSGWTGEKLLTRVRKVSVWKAGAKEHYVGTDTGSGQVNRDLLGLRRNSREAIGGSTVSMLKQRDGDPEVSKAEIEFNRVQKSRSIFLTHLFVLLYDAPSSQHWRTFESS